MKEKQEFNREEFLRHLIEKAKEDISGGNSPAPMFFLVGKEGVACVVMPMEDDAHKDLGVKALRKLVEKTGAEMYYSLFDAWTASPTDEKNLLKKAIKKVKSTEDLKDVLELT